MRENQEVGLKRLLSRDVAAEHFCLDPVECDKKAVAGCMS